MTYCIRRMCREDVNQVTEIDHEAFPTLLPPVNYQRELRNVLAHYLVACNLGRTAEPVTPTPGKGLPVIAKVWRLFHPHNSHSVTLLPTASQYIIGFVGIWILAGEAHIINLAVRELYRRRRIGELLLISTIDLAAGLEAHLLTLEVRVSNTAAQALYHRYGFRQVGLRRGYYNDNKEDAILMSTGDIGSASFRIRLQRLRQAHPARLVTVPESAANRAGYGDSC